MSSRSGDWGRGLALIDSRCSRSFLSPARPAAAADIAPVGFARPHRRCSFDQARPLPRLRQFRLAGFIALYWPSLTDPAHRGEPDRAKTLGDSGPRVWETFKARYELFQVGADGLPIAPRPWATYEAQNPCGADGDNRGKTLATFTPFMDFNQSAFLPGWPPIRWSRKIIPIRDTKGVSTNPSIRRSRLMAGAWARTCLIRPTPRTCLQVRSRSKPPGVR